MGTEIRCGGLLFTSKFDSGNLAAVEKVDRSDSDSDGAPNDPYGCRMTPDYEFNVWTKPDCGGTTFENGNRSWFYFGIRGNNPNKVIKINIVNLNRQGKLYSQGMAPLVKVLPYRPKWDRIRERATYQVVDGQFTLSFMYRFSEQKGGTTYFAFCYPWSYSESQEQLERIDEIFKGCADLKPGQAPDSAIYCHRELLCNSLDKRRIDLVTITSCKGMCAEREPRLENLFPDKTVPRAHTFKGKRVYYVSSRVHPGETPASFVFNGFLEFALRENDARAQALRDKYIIKLIPMLNPDGVYRGHYRTDQRGVNLNRLYLLPDFKEHPSIYASRSLLLFYHHFYRREIEPPASEASVKENGNGDAEDEQRMLISNSDGDVSGDTNDGQRMNVKPHKKDSLLSMCFGKSKKDGAKEAKFVAFQGDYTSIPPRDSGIAFYVDLHGHASKRGCFIYGNHLENEEDQVDNLLFPKLIAVNSAHFDFNGCNFTERNMYLKDKRDGMSKEGSGRVAIFKTIGIIHSYTLECNYNTGRTVNCIPPAVPNGKATPPPPAGFPPKYTPEIFEGVGRAMAIAALDFYGWNPWSRLKHSEFTSLDNLRHWMTRYVRSSRGNPILPRKMTNRIPVNPGLSNGTGSSGGSSNGNGRNANQRFSGNGDRKNGQVPTYARSSSLTTANGPYGKKAITVTKNQLSPFKSVSSSSVGNPQAGNRFTNRPKNLIRVTVNNTNRHAKTTQNQQDQTNKGFVGSKVKNVQETPVTLSFTTANNRATTSPIGHSDQPRDQTPTSLPNAVENLAFQMNEKLMLSMGLLDNPRILPLADGASTPYGHPPGFNLHTPQHDHQHHRMRVITPPVHHRGLPRSVRNNIIMQSLTQEYNINEADLASSDPRTVRFLNQRQASFLLGKSAALTSQAQKSLMQNQATQGNPRLHDNGFISPQVCRAPSVPSRGRSALSLYTSSTPVSQFLTPSEMRNGAVTPSGSSHALPSHALGTPQPVTLTFNGTDRHLPLTVTRMPIVPTKDENSNYVTKSGSGLLQPTTRPTIVNFRGKNGLVSENKSNAALKTKEDITGAKKIGRLRPPRRINSGHGEAKIRRAAPTHLSPKSGVDKEARYLKATKRPLGQPHHASDDGAMLSGEAVQLSPRVTKSIEELPDIVGPPTPTLDPGVHVATSSASPTAINANLMMMNCMPGHGPAPPTDL